MSFLIKAFLVSAFFYLVLLTFFGYEIGLGDSIEFLGYSLNRTNPDFIKNDLYISTMNMMIVNERSVFAAVISILPYNYPVLFFCLHAFLSIVLLIGLLRISQYFLSEFFSSCVAVAFAFVFFYGFNVGANELYHNSLQGTTFSVAFGVWAIYYLLIHKYSISYSLCVVALLFQPLEGFQLLLLCGGVGIIQGWYTNTVFKNILLWILFLLPASIYVLVLINQQKTGLGRLSTSQYFDAVFMMRFPHHFIPHYFSKKGMLVFGALYLIALPYFYRRNFVAFSFLSLMGLGCFLYCLDLYFGPAILVKSWWFRSTIWLKLFAFVALVGWLKEYLIEQKKYYRLCLLLVAVCFILFIGFYKGNIQRQNYHLGPDYKTLNPEIDICIQASKVSANGTVFVHPLSFTALSYYGRRASYVSYKAIPRTDIGILLWQNRLKYVYGLEPNRYTPAELVDSVNENYLKTDLEKLKNTGITHIITFLNHDVRQKKVLAKNELYKIVAL